VEAGGTKSCGAGCDEFSDVWALEGVSAIRYIIATDEDATGACAPPPLLLKTRIWCVG
jgi:hypothetical protein